MGSPDYVGAVHQVLDGIMLDLDVSADFLRGMTVAGVIVDYEAAEGDMIVDYDVPVGGYTVCDIMLRGGCAMVGAFAVGDVSFAEGSDFGGRGMTMGSEVAEGGVAIVADDAIVGGMIVAVDCDVAQELANVIGTDCRAKNGSAPDYVVVDGQSYVPVLPPGS
jgi:hypothetical protein